MNSNVIWATVAATSPRRYSADRNIQQRPIRRLWAIMWILASGTAGAQK